MKKKSTPKPIRTADDLPFILSGADLKNMGYSRNAVYAMFARSDFPSIQHGNRHYIRKDKFLAWLDQHEGEAI